MPVEIPNLDPREEHFRVPSSRPGLHLFLRYLPAIRRPNGAQRAVLYVHGATFPSGLSIAHRFDGYSWRDGLCAAGFDVWGFDFHGFGYSDRYPEMGKPAEANPPLCNADDANAQLGVAARFILDRQSLGRISLITHSWGSMPAGRFAGENPTLVDRLFLFAPISRRGPRRYETPPSAQAWRVVTLDNQWDRFIEDVPSGELPVLSRVHFDDWGERYLDSDPESRQRDPVGVKIPTGPSNDIIRAWHGLLRYDPALVQAPVAIVRGAWDGLVPDEDTRRIFDAFRTSSLKRDIKIGRATHLMHLEGMRYALYGESITFLLGGDDAQTSQIIGHRSQQTQSNGEKVMADRTQDNPKIPGYTYGTGDVAKSPISLEEWETLKKSAFLSDEDIFYLRLSHDVLSDQVGELLKAWRGIIFLNPHLLAYDEDPKTGKVDADYAAAVGKRFGQWVLDTAKAEYDQAWLDY